MIVFGTRLCGKVDETRVGHVVTRFVHVWFVPIVPLSSWFVVGESGRPIPLSLRSIVAAYLRGFGVVAALGSGGFFLYHLIFRFFEHFQIYSRGGSAVTEDEIVADVILLAASGVVAVLGVVAYLLTLVFRKASAARCAELGQAVGLAVTPLD